MNPGNLMSSDEHEQFLAHVGDLEEWNEDADFQWSDDPRIEHLSPHTVSVIHPFTRPVFRIETELQEEESLRMACAAVALYTPQGDRLALFISDPGRPNDIINTMWGRSV